jgi:hypothetical protein
MARGRSVERRLDRALFDHKDLNIVRLSTGCGSQEKSAGYKKFDRNVLMNGRSSLTYAL